MDLIIIFIGYIQEIDEERIHVAFDMGDVKKYPLDCKDKIVIDRNPLRHELVKDSSVLVTLARGKEMHRGII